MQPQHGMNCPICYSISRSEGCPGQQKVNGYRTKLTNNPSARMDVNRPQKSLNKVCQLGSRTEAINAVILEASLLIRSLLTSAHCTAVCATVIMNIAVIAKRTKLFLVLFFVTVEK